MSDRIVILREGQIEQVGTPAEMYDRPRTRYVADFIGQTNLLTADMSQVGTVGLPEIAVSYPNPGETYGNGRWVASIRPEKLEIRPAINGERTLRLTVLESIFFGDVVECSGVHATGKVLHFRVARRDAMNLPRRGQAVDLAFRPGDVVLLPEA